MVNNLNERSLEKPEKLNASLEANFLKSSGHERTLFKSAAGGRAFTCSIIKELVYKVMIQQSAGTKDVATQIKNPDLVERRRQQIVGAAAKLFIEKGFHKTTTRQIANAAGFSIGSLYEYVASKEDVLYLVCESIHAEVEQGVSQALNRVSGGKELIAEVIREYFLVCHRMSDFILLVYQETQSLPPQWKKRVLENELRITGLIVKVLADIVTSGDFPRLDERSIELAAHNITVLGHMWTFRRWFLARHYSIEDYIERQTDFILGTFT